MKNKALVAGVAFAVGVLAAFVYTAEIASVEYREQVEYGRQLDLENDRLHREIQVKWHEGFYEASPNHKK